MQKIRNYELTHKLLESYQIASLENASELLAEAGLLLINDHFSRAYFLALASIEETGKAYLAFDAKGRNLQDGGLCNKIKERFEHHFTKITSAFAGLIFFLDSKREVIKTSVNLMIHLLHGREKSMYIDVKSDGVTLSIPRVVVRPVAARDCVRLAKKCLHHTKLYLQHYDPTKRSSHQDKLLCINLITLTAIVNTEDFWEFYINQLKQENNSFNQALATYHDTFYKKNRAFKIP